MTIHTKNLILALLCAMASPAASLQVPADSRQASGVPGRAQATPQQEQATSQQASATLSVGVAKKAITPGPEVKNWVTGRPYEKIHEPVYVRALFLGDSSTEAVIISWDLVDAGESATHEVRKRIKAEMGIAEDHVLVNATHNHSAPWSPVYSSGYRGKERDTWWALRYMPPQNDDPHFKKWMALLLDQTLAAVREARQSAKPASIWIGRADISAYFQNRRPRPAKRGIAAANTPKGFNFRHEEWNPDVLPGGASFGPMDRTMTLLSFRDAAGKTMASVYHLSGHAVALYPYTDGITADWPGTVSAGISNALGGETVFLQGTAGDINPGRRGFEAVQEMEKGITALAKAAHRYSAQLETGKIKAGRIIAALPLTNYGQNKLGIASVSSEVQVISIGPLAFVTLPGEPMTELGMAIRKHSPFPQTLVLGYSNGNGVHYVGMPGEKMYGGYETGEQASIGTDEAGPILVKTAVKLLNQLAPEQP